MAILHTHHARSTGPFLGSPPTGARVVVPGIELFRFSAGKIAEFWRFDADVSLLGQLGLLPALQPAASVCEIAHRLVITGKMARNSITSNHQAPGG